MACIDKVPLIHFLPLSLKIQGPADRMLTFFSHFHCSYSLFKMITAPGMRNTVIHFSLYHISFFFFLFVARLEDVEQGEISR